MRLTLYTRLFLTPWMMVYALSGFCLNHATWFAGEQAVALLVHLGLEGPHQIMGGPTGDQLASAATTSPDGRGRAILGV